MESRVKTVEETVESMRSVIEEKITPSIERVIRNEIESAADQIALNGTFALSDEGMDRTLRDLYRLTFIRFARWQYNELRNPAQKIHGEEGEPQTIEEKIEHVWGVWVLTFFLAMFFGKITAIMSAQRRIINLIIDRGIRNGLTSTQIVVVLRSQAVRISQRHAKKIAKTEVVSASNAGALEGAKAFGAHTKIWNTQRDERVRRGQRGFNHRVMHEREAPVAEAFVVSGERLSHPGDTSQGASPGNVINCRCFMTYIV